MSEFENRAHPETIVPFSFDANLNANLLYVGVDGDVEIMLQGSEATVILEAVVAGSFISLPIQQVVSAGTTSSTASEFATFR